MFSIFRIYNHKDWLKPHIDRPSCEFSATIPIFTDSPWPIYMQKFNFKKYPSERRFWNESAEKEESTNLILELGDVCFYEGTKMNHWRWPFEGNECYQLFIHYVRKNGEFSEFKFDKRPNLGCSAESKRNEYSIDNFL